MSSIGLVAIAVRTYDRSIVDRDTYQRIDFDKSNLPFSLSSLHNEWCYMNLKKFSCKATTDEVGLIL